MRVFETREPYGRIENAPPPQPKWFKNENPKSPNAAADHMVAFAYPTGERLRLTRSGYARAVNDYGREADDFATMHRECDGYAARKRRSRYAWLVLAFAIGLTIATVTIFALKLA